jgi:hypothetical protein
VLTEKEWTQINVGFIGMVDHRSVEVTDDIMLHYLEIAPHLSEAEKIQQKVREDIQGIFQDTDYFEPEDYDLTGQFFSYKDYEAFFPRNQRLSVTRVPQRKDVQNKFLDLAKALLPQLHSQGMNLYVHWSSNHITSLIQPMVYNALHVSWLGVRFGKHQDEVMRLTSGAEDDEFIGFQKHACLQISISGDKFETALYHAVPHDAVDRPYLHEQMQKRGFCQRLVDKLRTFEGRPCYWIVDSVVDEFSFDFETQKAEDFPEFYCETDRDGYYSYLCFQYEADDKQISKKNIQTTILNNFKLFYPVFESVAKRY